QNVETNLGNGLGRGDRPFDAAQDRRSPSGSVYIDWKTNEIGGVQKMPTAIIDVLDVNYEKRGSGPALIMFAPGGFDATMDKWLSASAWKEINALDTLAEEHTLILYDRRECGQSGGRVERLSWGSYTKQAKAKTLHTSPRLSALAPII